MEHVLLLTSIQGEDPINQVISAPSFSNYMQVYNKCNTVKKLEDWPHTSLGTVTLSSQLYKTYSRVYILDRGTNLCTQCPS